METVSEMIQELQEKMEDREFSQQCSEKGKGYQECLDDLRKRFYEGKEKPSMWEDIGMTIPRESSCGNTYRMKVFGGWLIRASEYVYSDKKNYSSKIYATVTFVADPEHKWEVKS